MFKLKLDMRSLKFVFITVYLVASSWILFTNSNNSFEDENEALYEINNKKLDKYELKNELNSIAENIATSYKKEIKQENDVNSILVSIENIISFFERNTKSVNVDGLYGVRIAEGKHKNKLYNILKLKLI